MQRKKSLLRGWREEGGRGRKRKEDGEEVSHEDVESLTERERSGRKKICIEKGTVKWMEREEREREKA